MINYEYIITEPLHNLVAPVAPTIHNSIQDKMSEKAITLSNRAHENQHHGFWNTLKSIGSDIGHFAQKLGRGIMNQAGKKALSWTGKKLGVEALESMALAVAGKTDFKPVRGKNFFKPKRNKNKKKRK